MICLFDHEEIGSVSAQGADSTMLTSSLERIYGLLSNNKNKTDSYYKALGRSFLISADMAHATHPNYSEKH
jgi:aspartyl aminopeptidase